MQYLSKMPTGILSHILYLSRYRSNLNEALNTMLAQKSDNIRELLSPLEDFPPVVLKHIEKDLPRRNYQINYHKLVTLYTLRRLLDTIMVR